MADRGSAVLPSANDIGPDAEYHAAPVALVAHYAGAELPDDSIVVDVPIVSTGQLYPN